MNKYIYTPLEYISDLDITGDTEYFLFEEGVGHRSFTSAMKQYKIYELESLISNRQIFAREEKPWYERIPEKGVLCKNTWSGKGYRLIIRYDEEDDLVFDEDGNHYTTCSLVPLTNNEIKRFLQEEDEG